jgi:hypothetical protein
MLQASIVISVTLFGWLRGQIIGPFEATASARWIGRGGCRVGRVGCRRNVFVGF